MKVAIGCDHGGINLKPVLIDYLKKNAIEYKDFGCHTTESVDYNDYALQVSTAVGNGEYDFGILICGTGIGMSIVANKVKGVRCGHCHDVFSAKKPCRTRQGNLHLSFRSALFCSDKKTGEPPFKKVLSRLFF